MFEKRIKEEKKFVTDINWQQQQKFFFLTFLIRFAILVKKRRKIILQAAKIGTKIELKRFRCL